MAITYIPNVGGSVIFLSIFSLLLIYQAWQLRYRAWSYSLAMILGILLEIGGYIARVQLRFGSFNTDVINLVFLAIGPIFFLQAIYLSASRVIGFFATVRFYPSLKWTNISLMFSSFIALAIEFIGGGIAGAANTTEVMNQGTQAMAAGLLLQGAMTISCAGLAINFGQMIRRENKSRNGSYDIEALAKVEKLAVCLALATLFIIIRTLFRATELCCGGIGVPAEDETRFVILESSMTTIGTILLTVIHPGTAFGRAWRNAGWEWGRKADPIEDKASSDESPVGASEKGGFEEIALDRKSPTFTHI
ncbi:RTA1 like protein-domain-containing protein [Amylocarpus encephaloides]|uniref:RTA1 like protein-domain-containing protein n=1 Tax=Amylocarpus encephaloides TaxID=45428 RepID=A0A9P7YDI9_9HELO|nr:RTA1 like protein-domain-containing protein [Amylocarpus encephaloides]